MVPSKNTHGMKIMWISVRTDNRDKKHEPQTYILPDNPRYKMLTYTEHQIMKDGIGEAHTTQNVTEEMEQTIQYYRDSEQCVAMPPPHPPIYPPAPPTSYISCLYVVRSLDQALNVIKPLS
ncbi:hypothetical protein J6590_082072 [Homalodisca vitripennis]|nr:hypothetical protein J6590_081549 [Homalodisca vitripennis]KAG8285344.1 hypothetical protein J6590_082072 [Homalodisca vitripennis]